MKTPISYYGGKQQLASKIVSLFPEHKIYCEPFIGGAAVFFAKPQAHIADGCYLTWKVTVRVVRPSFLTENSLWGRNIDRRLISTLE